MGEQREWLEVMSEQYGLARQRMIVVQRKLAERHEPDPSDVTKVNSMVAEMAWVIDWLRTGRQPGLTRGIDRRGAYRGNRRVVLDEDLFPSLQEPPRAIFSLSDEQRDEALAAIRSLSERELRCLQMYVVEGLSEYAIAKHLKISRSTVQTNIRRAKNKIPGDQMG